MAQTEAQLRASKKYHAQFDEVKIRLPKGQRKVWQDHAASNGESLTGLIRRSVYQTIYDEEKQRKEAQAKQNQKKDDT